MIDGLPSGTNTYLLIGKINHKTHLHLVLPGHGKKQEKILWKSTRIFPNL
jgi:hypothetical protein